jgi:hypothetical protein
MNKIFFLALLSLFSCHNRNPNLSEKQLLALMADDESSMSTSVSAILEGYVPEAGVKYRQERDLSVPPVRIDVLKDIDDVRNVTLSRLASDIAYINIGKHRFGVNVQITLHGILVSSFDGVWLYSTEGELIRELYKNLCEYQPTGNLGVMVKTGDKFRGIEQLLYNEKDDRIWLKFREDDLGVDYRGYLGYIDMSRQLNISDSEIKQNQIIPLAGFGHGMIGYAENFVIHRTYGRTHTMTTNTFFGDTLCRYIFGYDSITAKIFQDSRSGDFGSSYYYHGTYSIRPQYNDTLFRLTAANVLKPEYIIEMSNKGKQNYDQMNILQPLHEDDRFLYLSFSTGNFNGTNVRRQWWRLYDKNKREVFTLPVDTEGWLYERGVENDLDGGLPFWPDKIGGRGEKFMNIPGKEMKTLLTETWLSKSKATQSGKKDELKQFVQTLKDDDLVIVIVK